MPILLSGTWRGEKLIFTLNAERKYLGAKQFLSYLIQKRILSNLPNKSYAHKPHLQECKQNCLSIYHRPQPTATLYYRWFMGTLYSQTANGTI